MEVDKKPTDPKALREIANSDEVQDICRRVALDIRNDARRLAPVRTGNLRRHIVIEPYTDLKAGVDGFAVGWDDKGWYGWMVEAGTEHNPPRPHLAPAAIKHGAKLVGGGL